MKKVEHKNVNRKTGKGGKANDQNKGEIRPKLIRVVTRNWVGGAWPVTFDSDVPTDKAVIYLKTLY